VSKSNAFENAFLLLVLNNTDIAGIGDAGGLRGSVVAGDVFVSLHTADPGEAGTQSTNETTYTSYARVAVARTAGGWTVVGNVPTNTAAVTFPTCTAGAAQNVTHFSVGVASAGGTMVLFKGALAASVSVGPGVTPLFQAGQLTGTED
jgi:hypothetical protein